jgi:hypothetical protein
VDHPASNRIPEPVRLGHRQAIGVDVHTNYSGRAIADHCNFRYRDRHEHSPAPGILNEAIRDRLPLGLVFREIPADRGHDGIVPVGEPD